MDINKKIKYLLTFYGLYIGATTLLSLNFIKNKLWRGAIFIVIICIITILFSYMINLIEEKFQNIESLKDSKYKGFNKNLSKDALKLGKDEPK